MTKKGKKKKQQTQGEAASTSTASTSQQETSQQQQQQQDSQQQQTTQQTLQQKQQKKKPQQTQDLSHQQSPQQASSQQQQRKEQTQASGAHQQPVQPQQQPPPQQKAWGPRQQTPPVQQVTQQQTQGPRQQQPPSQKQVPQQQAWGPPQQQPPPQQQVRGPRQQIPPVQQTQGPSQQRPPPQQQVWGPRQQTPLVQQATQQQTQGPPQQQPPPQQQAWGPRQQIPPVRQTQGPPQQQPPPQQQVWGPRQQIPPVRQTQGPPQQQPPPQQQVWGPRQQIPPAQQTQGPPQQQPPPQQQVWGPRQQIPPAQQTQGPPQQQPPPQQQVWGPRQQIPPAQQTQGPPQQQPPPQQQVWGPRQQIPPAQQTQGPPQQQPPPQQQVWGPRQQIPPSQQVTQQQVQVPRQRQPPSQQQVPQQQVWGLPQQQPQTQQAQGLPQQQPQQQIPPQRAAAASPSTSQLSTLSQLTISDIPKPSEASKKPRSELKQVQLTIPQRPNLLKAGTVGKLIRVQTNVFEIKFHPNFVTNAVHYDIDISPIASKSIYRRVFEECRKCYFSNRFPAFDGKKNAYSANNLPFNDHMTADVQIYDEGRGRDRDFTITFTRVADVDLSWIKNLRPGLDEANRDQTGIQVLDIIMRHAPSSRLLPLGRSFFSPASTPATAPKPLGRGVTLHIGPFSSAILGWKPYLNIDVCHKGFATPQLVTALMKELSGNDGLNAEAVKQNEEKINKFLTGLKVDYEVPTQANSKRTYRINGIGPNAREIEFEFDGSIGTVDEFFKRKKNYKLQWPTLPCLWVGSQTKEQKTYLPAELCKIVDGQPIKRLDEFQTSAMIRFSATDTFRRRQKISDAFSLIDVNNSDTMRNEFHLSIDGRMKEVEARILPAPDLQYSQTTATVNKGVWRPGIFNQAMQLENHTWTILNLNRYLLESHLRPFVDALTRYANNVGMYIGKPLTPFQTMRSPEQDIRGIMNYFQEKKNLRLVIVVLPDRTDRAYSKVKQVTELKVGVLTQCIKTKTLTEKCNEQTIKNILLKINSKLNGINHTFTRTGMPFCLRNANCMLVGADVSHPSPDAKNIPSIAAVAASHDEAAFKYNIEVKLQEPKKEMIVDFEEIILKQIVIYNNQTGKLPTRIIFYRDGVSEGQLAQVMYYEVSAIKRACAQIARTKPTFKPEITCLVVQKRHHIRLFPTNKQDTDDRNNNVKAGTIVDKEITHPNHIDFYLVSHASVQGTAKPTKYRCICNESNFNEDQIEQLTYYLCHMFARCTRSVSYPAPTYYAHLAAYRGRAWIQEVPINMSNLAEEQRKKLSVKMASTPMFTV